MRPAVRRPDTCSPRQTDSSCFTNALKSLGPRTRHSRLPSAAKPEAGSSSAVSARGLVHGLQVVDASKHATPARPPLGNHIAHCPLCFSLQYRRSLATPIPSSHSLHAISTLTLSHDAAPCARAIFESGHTLITRLQLANSIIRVNTLPCALSGPPATLHACILSPLRHQLLHSLTIPACQLLPSREPYQAADQCLLRLPQL